jgi:hypothetical protein
MAENLTVADPDPDGPPNNDVPDVPEIPAEVADLIAAIRRDPAQTALPGVKRKVTAVEFGQPPRDAWFRTWPNTDEWLPVHCVTIKKGINYSKNQDIIVTPNVLTNPAVAQRSRPAWLVPYATSEGEYGVWLIRDPDQVGYERSYPSDSAKYGAAMTAREAWTNIAWDDERNVHQVETTAKVQRKVDWPDGGPTGMIALVVRDELVFDPNAEEFDNLTVKRNNK